MTLFALHGGGIDAACAHYGGVWADWLDLSTGINPIAFPIPELDETIWARLPDDRAFDGAVSGARHFWNVPQNAAILPVHGLSSAIALLPRILKKQEAYICEPTYSEYHQNFLNAGWKVTRNEKAPFHIYVHPNNPDGRLARLKTQYADFMLIDESFCDLTPKHSFIHKADAKGVLILKSFGKFWGLAGLRLGFVIGDRSIVAKLAKAMGPWHASGPALQIAYKAFNDCAWANKTRARLENDAKRLDAIIRSKTQAKTYGTNLFRLYESIKAHHLYETLCHEKILTRIFSYRSDWVRVGLPGKECEWVRLQHALDAL